MAVRPVVDPHVLLEHAFDWLRRAVAERSHWLVWLLRDNRWQRLRGDPRFQEIVRKVGLPG